MSKAVDIIDTYTDGDTLPPLVRTHLDGTTDITGWTITLRLRQPDGFVLERVASVTNGPVGEFTVTWQAGDLVGDDALQEAEFRCVPGGGGQFTDGPIFFNVRKSVA